MQQPGRLASLDGLRGAAAAIVLVHHAMLTFVVFAEPYYRAQESVSDPLVRVLSYTPFHVLWGGTEAVYLFFVLSGMVLVLPVLQSQRRFSWLEYYPRRIARIYLPVGAAVLLAAATVLLVPRFDDPQLSLWMNNRPNSYELPSMLRDFALLFGPSRVVSPLWSLQWEMLFSLLLPAYVVFASRWRRGWWVKSVLLLAAIVVGSAADEPTLLYLPMFAVGALLASHWDALSSIVDSWGGRVWPLATAIALLALSAGWSAEGLGWVDSRQQLAVLAVVGAAILVVASAHWTRLRRALEHAVFAWLGKISFALYLIHEPIVIALRFATFPLPSWVGLAIAVPLSLALAAAFAAWIEQPAHRISKRVGRSVGAAGHTLTSRARARLRR